MGIMIIRDETTKKGPDCTSCIRYVTCEIAREGYFCAIWQSEEPKDKGSDPNDAWSRGEDVPF